MQFVANNFNIGALFRDIAHSGGCDSFTKAVILADHVDFFDGVITGNHIGQSVHLDVGIRVKSEMPKVAFIVCQRGVDCGIVQE